uniref:Sulfotransferase domain-containing protein n=1 Tax=Helicotheca tamesis TaxID=374047 RepID=A0A7S2DW83_9STRA
MQVTKHRFGKMLLCGVLSVCILGTFAFLMSVTNFGTVGSPTVDPPTAYLDVTLPREIDVHFADWKHHEHDDETTTRYDVPIFWSIPLTGNDVIEEYLGGCLGLIQASEVGILGNVDEEDDASLKEVDIHGLSYINVDLRTRHGIEHATRMHLIDDHKNGDLSLTPDVVHTPLLYESAQLFENPNVNQGKIITILRDPMERAVALYQQIIISESWTKSAAGGGFMNDGSGGANMMSLSDYAESDYVENNWLTRTLCNKPTGRITEVDLKVAKEILRRKVLVGLYDNVPLALSYFKHKFDWVNNKNNKHHLNQQRQRELKKRSLVTTVQKGGDFTKDHNYFYSHCTTIGVEEALKKESEGWLWMKAEQLDQQTQLVKGSYAWTLLKRENEFDIELYEYAKTVHEYQFSSYRHRGRHRGMKNEHSRGRN